VQVSFLHVGLDRQGVHCPIPRGPDPPSSNSNVYPRPCTFPFPPVSQGASGDLHLPKVSICSLQGTHTVPRTRSAILVLPACPGTPGQPALVLSTPVLPILVLSASLLPAMDLPHLTYHTWPVCTGPAHTGLAHSSPIHTWLQVQPHSHTVLFCTLKVYTGLCH
jgi:hypothetical protein